MLEVRLLGQFDVRLDGKPIEIASRPAQTLLAYLLVHAGIKQRREKLAGELWREGDESNARSNLRHALWRLGRAFGEHKYFVADASSIAFDKDADYWLDVAVLKQKEPSPASADVLMPSVVVYRGEFLPGVYDEWVSDERERLQVAFDRKMEKLLELLQAEQRWSDVLEWAEQQVAWGSNPEPAYAALMVAHARLGDLSSVASTYQRCVESLRRKFDIEPSAQTVALYQSLIKVERVAAPSPKPKPQPPTPHVPAPAVATSHPPTSDALPPTPPHNLPPQLTPFFGRSAELDEIADRLADPACRLLTLIGLGGMGKTRLALQAASAQVSALRDGVCFVPLASVPSAELIVPALADALKFSFYTQEKPWTQLLNYLREKELLLVLDNFEHLVEGVNLLEELLTVAPQVKLLVTSRERLHLQWEWLLEVEGLAYPESDGVSTIADYGAVQLFVQTARRLHSRFALDAEKAGVIRICRLTRGMPLALELAAALVRTLSCAEIANEIERTQDLLATNLRDVPARHRSIRATFESSWSLLSESERTAFKRLSLSPSGFQREAAEQVADAPLALLFSLIDKSLVRRTSAGRYEIHELLRQYATEKPNADDEMARERMARYYLAYAQAHPRDYAAFEAEWSNLSAGMSAAHRRQLWRVVIDYGDALADVWVARARYTEARQSYPLMCEAARALGDTQALATSLQRWGCACVEQGDYAEAEDLLTQSIPLFEQVNDRCGLGDAQYELVRVAIETANFDRAKHLLAACRENRSALNDQPGLAQVLYMHARIAYRFREYAEADRLGRQALDIQQAAGKDRDSMETLGLLAIVASVQDNHDAAERYAQRALSLAQELQNQGELGSALYNTSIVLRLRGNAQSAQDYAQRSLALFRLMGDRKAQALAYHQLSKIAADLQDYPTALQQALQSLDLSQALQDALATMGVLLDLGDTLQHMNEVEQAQQRWSESLAIAERLQHPLVSKLRERLGRL